MAIPVRTNEAGLIAAEDLRRITIEVGGVMKRLQTGKRVSSASEDVGALVQSASLTRTLSTLQIASEQITKGQSVLAKVEDTLQSIAAILDQMRQNAERAVLSNDPNEIAVLQASSDELYREIREIVRSTVFQKQVLLRGGMGSTVIGPVTMVITTAGQPVTIYRQSIDVSGINLAGYASGTLADVAVSNLVTVIGQGGVAQGMFTSSVSYGSYVSVSLAIGGGIATASLRIGGTPVMTESIRINFTGPQVLDFVNLGMRVYVEEPIGVGPGSTMAATIITIQRQEAKFLRGANVSSLMDYVQFDIPNLEPENLLGPVSLGGGAIFTFDLRAAPETAVTLIREAIEYVESVRARVGATRNMLEISQTQIQNQRIIAQVQRSAIIDTKFDEDALELTALQVIQQSANAMVAISRLTPQLVLQLLG